MVLHLDIILNNPCTALVNINQVTERRHLCSPGKTSDHQQPRPQGLGCSRQHFYSLEDNTGL
jgi:hypothetical protein